MVKYTTLQKISVARLSMLARGYTPKYVIMTDATAYEFGKELYTSLLYRSTYAFGKEFLDMVVITNNYLPSGVMYVTDVHQVFTIQIEDEQYEGN